MWRLHCSAAAFLLIIAAEVAKRVHAQAQQQAMLSGISFTDRALVEREHEKDKSKKKKKEKKKHKKEKSKHSKAKHESEDASDHDPASDSPASEGGAGSPAEHGHGAAPAGAAAASTAPAVEREAWMTVPMASSVAKPAAAEAQEQEEAAKAHKEPVEHVGLRIMDTTQAAGAAGGGAAEAGRASGPSVGDGGASWRLKALKRAQQAARDSGQNVAAVVAERWGSAAALSASLTQGRAAPDKAHLQEARRRAAQASGNGDAAGGAGGKPATATAHYLNDLRSDRPQMMRPTGATSVTWRRGGGSSGRGDRGEGGADRAGEKQQSGEGRSSGRGTADEGSRDGRDSSRGRVGSERGAETSDREHPRELSGSRNGREGRASKEPAGRRSPSPGRPDRRQHDGARSREEGKTAGREADRPDGRGEGRGERREHDRTDAEAHKSRDGGRGNADGGRGGRGGNDGRGRPGQDRHHAQQQRGARQADAAVLEMAGVLNTFSDDGSFMDRFQQQQPEQGSNAEAAGQKHRDAGAERSERPSQSGSPTSEDDRPSSSGRAPAAGTSRAPLTAPIPDGNKGMAALLRARLGGGGGGPAAGAAGGTGGNKDMAAALRARLGGKPPVAAAGAGSGNKADSVEATGASGRKEVVLLPQVDASGRAAPGAFGREAGGDARRSQEAAAGGRVAKRVQRYGADGSKERYFADDDNVDLQTLVKRAKYGDDAGDMDATLARNIATRERFKATDLDVDDEYDHDAGLELYESRRKRGDAQQQANRERERQIADFRRTAAREDACTHCFASAKRPRALTIAVGQSTYLALVQKGRLTDGHCCIMPAEHIGSMRQVDEAVWTEVRNFQKCLIQMFMEQGKEVLFLETATNLGMNRRHAILEAIPLSPDEMGKAPLYYRKAMQEAESEWSQHASKAVIETKTKGLRGSVPPNFPYFYVQFGYANGYVHVIDDERKFDVNLGRQVAVGLLRLPPEAMHQRSRTDAPAVVAAAAANFRKAFARYDWTAQLAA